MRSLCLSAAALVMAAMPALAQKPGTVEIGAFARQTWFDDSYELKDRAGAGARLGVFILPNFELEAQGTWVRTDSKRIDINHNLDVFSGRGLLEYNINLAPVAIVLGVGATYTSFTGDVNLLQCPSEGSCGENDEGTPVFGPTLGSDRTEVGPVGLIGLRFGVGGLLQARIDATYDYISTTPNALSGADWGNHWGLQGGLSLMFPKPKPADTDLDGVPDKVDQCPNTPAGMPVDEKGCPLDDDKDSVINANDLCPNTPAGEAVDASGCSDSQKDDDRDGVMNSLDKCPNTPTGSAVDENGCPRDDDGDGVANPADRCPNTPKGETVDANGCSGCQVDADNDGVADCNDKCPATNPGNKVDANGCRLLAENNTLILRGVTFASGRSALTKASKATLDEVATQLSQFLAEVPSGRIEVGGHTDSTGSAKTNTRLSAQRAAAVEKYLESKGIDPDRLVSKGYGPDKPVADNKTKAGRAENRRVELIPLY
jgi:outer membrane protein OmpA-like peptidoglycan-associated protein